jgi:hypothetical protein
MKHLAISFACIDGIRPRASFYRLSFRMIFSGKAELSKWIF